MVDLQEPHVSDSAPVSPSATRVVVADDSRRYRDGLVRAMQRRGGLEVVGAVAGGNAALELILDLRPDVALLDVRMPDLDAAGVLRGLRDAPNPPATRVVVISAQTEGDHIEAVRAAHPALVLDKASTRATICDALERIGAGRPA